MSNNNPKPDFNALFKLGTFTVNVPTNVNNANVNPSENNVIKANGEYNVPNDKTGWNSFSVNVTPTITPNVADLMITNDVYDYVKKNHDGMVILPGNDPTVVEETMFDTHGKDYATSVIIDLNFLKTELKIDPNHQKIRLSEDEEDFEVYDYEKDGDYDVRVKPKPEPEPTKNKSRFITFKSNTRDIIEDDPTYRNIGSFTIIAPILNSIVLPAGTYTFNIGIYNNENNTDYLGVKTITFTPSPPNVQPKTITIDTIGNNQSTTYNASNDNVDGYNSVTIINNTSSAVPLENKNIEYNLGVNIPNTITPSSGYYGINNVTFSPITSGNVCTNLFQGVTLEDVQSRVNTELNLFTSLPTVTYNNHYFTINKNSVTNAMLYSIVSSGNQQLQSDGGFNAYLWSDIPFIANSFNFTYRGYCDIHVSNDAINWNKVISVPGHYTDVKTYNVEVPQISASWKFYRFSFTGGWVYLNKITSLFCSNSSYNNPNINLENNKRLTLSSNDINSTVLLNPSTGYHGFSNAIITVPDITPNPKLEEISGLEYTSNGNYGIETKWGYDGIKSVDFRINVPQTLYTYPTITTNGTYIIPENYVGLNIIKVNIDPNNPNPTNPPAKPTKEATDNETIMLENGTYWSGLRIRNSNGEYIGIGSTMRDFNGIYINNWSSPEYNTFILSRKYGTGIDEFILFTIKNNREANYPITIFNDLTNEYKYKNEWTNELETIYGMYTTDTPSYHTFPGFTTYGPVNDLANFDSSSINVSSLLKTTLYIEVGTY